jgi:predicted metal-dependent hydrolase
LGDAQIPLQIVRHPRARRYILRLRPDGSARVTIPHGGSLTAAREFVARQSAWIERQRQQLRERPPRRDRWQVGSEILLRGEPARIEATADACGACVRVGSERLRVADLRADLRSQVEQHLWRLACRELPPRLLDYAALHQLLVRRVTVRNQRTRWGSCSRHGNISLNWRLIQTPPFVRDYICLHELMHLREMNHSKRFWREVEAVCPYYRTAEQWLKTHSRLLR